MFLDKVLVLDQNGIFLQLFRDFRMAVQEPIHIREFFTGYVAVPFMPVCRLVPVEPLLLPHKGSWIFSELFPDSSVLLQVLLEGWMLRDELIVVDQQRILLQLLCDLRMAVEELVHLRDLPS